MNVRSRVALAAFAILIVAAGSPVPPPAPAAPAKPGAPSPLAAHTLLTGIEARIGRDGSVRIIGRAGGVEEALLEIPAQGVPRSRSAGADAPFTGRFREGDDRGHRGFAPRADDDQDGRVDEDRADGRDNDGDGRVDEDFAAISDAMAVVDHGPAGAHLEVYRWAYPHLRSTLFLCWDDVPARRDGDGGAVTLTVAGEAWHETDLSWRPASDERAKGAPRRATLVATAVDGLRETGAGSRVWLGLVRLVDEQVRPKQPLRIDGPRLSVALENGGAEVAVCVAPTLLQLRFSLAQALAVHEGAAGLPDAGRVQWIVPPLRPSWLAGGAPQARCEVADDPGEGWRLVLEVRPGDNALLDPDRFILDGRPLGSPRAISWEPALVDGESVAGTVGGWTVRWSPAAPEQLRSLAEEEQDPFLVRPEFGLASTGGRLAFLFPPPAPTAAPAPAPAPALEGALLSGRTFSAELVCPALGQDETTNSDETDADARESLHRDLRAATLSPSLLDNYPNPFRGQTRLRFRVPFTVEEAFAEGAREGRILLDPGAPVPYRSPPPQVSLKVYSLIGQEIRTIHSGSLESGQYEMFWDGADHAGRQVAAGTYFCKLQIEGWSVTKRIVLLR